MSEYADLMRQLDTVERQLAAMARDDFAGLHRLLTERDNLHEAIRSLLGDVALTDDRPVAEIEREVAALKASAATLRNQRINLATQAGRSNSVGDVRGDMGINQRMDEASGYNAIQQRIGQLEAILANRRA